ncbi:MAG: CoA transferase [Betaproteobacteria bacterium]|nr:CoA transferase [Betaproteobacteria bacterium]
MKAATPLQAPLNGVRIVEFEGIGPGPLAGQMLVGMGADLTVIARPQRGALNDHLGGQGDNPMRRGKHVVLLDLKQPDALAQAKAQVAGADALIEGNRPGVMERLGLGPADCAADNPALVYGRMTGWGQTGPLAQAAGHDLNYVALTGLLSLSAYRGQRPILPPTVLGDAAGALGLAFGIVCALLDARRSGTGRVVDGAIVDVVAMLGGIAQMVRAAGQIDGPEPSPFHDAPFYDVYTCDGGYITLGALEPQFHALLLAKLGLTDVDPAAQYDTSTWPALRARLAALFVSQPRAHWCALLEGSDACFAPVLSLAEAACHPHNVARGIYNTDTTGAIEATVAPRFQALSGSC